MSPSSRILIEKLDIYAYHGAYAQENELGQRFLLDLELEADLHRPAVSDELADTVDYGRVVAEVSQAFRARRFKLLEAAARAVALAVFDGFPPVSAVTVTLRKTAPPIDATLGSVGVRLVFRRGD